MTSDFGSDLFDDSDRHESDSTPLDAAASDAAKSAPEAGSEDERPARPKRRRRKAADAAEQSADDPAPPPPVDDVRDERDATATDEEEPPAKPKRKRRSRKKPAAAAQVDDDADGADEIAASDGPRPDAARGRTSKDAESPPEATDDASESGSATSERDSEGEADEVRPKRRRSRRSRSRSRSRGDDDDASADDRDSRSDDAARGGRAAAADDDDDSDAAGGSGGGSQRRRAPGPRGQGRGRDEDRPARRSTPAPAETWTRRRSGFPGVLGQRAAVFVDVDALLDHAPERGEIAFTKLRAELGRRRNLIRTVAYGTGRVGKNLSGPVRQAGFDTRASEDAAGTAVSLAIDAVTIAPRVDCVTLVPGTPSPGMDALIESLRAAGVRVERASFSDRDDDHRFDAHIELGRESIFTP